MRKFTNRPKHLLLSGAAAAVLTGAFAVAGALPNAGATTTAKHHDGAPAPSGVAISGTIESLGSGSIVVQDREGFWRTVMLEPTTTYSEGPMKVATAITSANLATGEKITAFGTVDANHTSLDASAVKIDFDRLGGKVTSVSPTAVVVSLGHSSASGTIDVSSSTIVFNRTGVVTMASVTVGSRVEGFGMTEPDGSLNALYLGVASTPSAADTAYLTSVHVPNCFFAHHYGSHHGRR